MLNTCYTRVSNLRQMVPFIVVVDSALDSVGRNCSCLAWKWIRAFVCVVITEMPQFASSRSFLWFELATACALTPTHTHKYFFCSLSVTFVAFFRFAKIFDINYLWPLIAERSSYFKFVAFFCVQRRVIVCRCISCKLIHRRGLSISYISELKLKRILLFSRDWFLLMFIKQCVLWKMRKLL